VRLAIVGGKLQGTEAVYLAAKAGYETVLIDRRPAPPAAGLADYHYVLDVVAEPAKARALLGACDAVLPACEDDVTLAWLADQVPALDVPLLFDRDAYHVSSSKLRSNELFARLDVPRPRPWPECGFPAVVKPSSASGSIGVHIVASEQALAAARNDLESDGHDVVVEEYVAGPSLSLEVIRFGGDTAALLPTALEFDAVLDCKRVTAPVAADLPTLAAFAESARRLAEGIDLQGVMDVEVMVGGRGPQVIEIDARLPSQTPTAVLHACDVNIVEMLVEAATTGVLPAADCTARRATVYEHVRVAGGTIENIGEHVMSRARPLTAITGFFGALEALTDYSLGATEWVATLITRGADVAEAGAIATAVVAAIAHEFDLEIRPEAKR
jgi:pyrrolysine biosynthesis protein PylC